MLLPKRVKHRRQFRGSMAGKATRLQMVNMVSLQQNHAGLSQIR